MDDAPIAESPAPGATGDTKAIIKSIVGTGIGLATLLLMLAGLMIQQNANVNARIDDVNARIDDVNARIDDVNARIGDVNARRPIVQSLVPRHFETPRVKEMREYHRLSVDDRWSDGVCHEGTVSSS